MPSADFARLAAAILLMPAASTDAQPMGANASDIAQQAAAHDGSHDFDFLIGTWKSHVRRLPDRFVNSAKWIDYDGAESNRKIAGSNSNLEEFEARSPKDGSVLKAQTLRLYNPSSRQWSIYLVDADKGTIELPPLIGQFSGNRGEFYEYTEWKGRAILVRFTWTSLSPHRARFEQAFSPDGGKTWEVNWTNDITR